jgi:hypothetical protein
VYECGAGKYVATTSSLTLVVLADTLVNVA